MLARLPRLLAATRAAPMAVGARCTAARLSTVARPNPTALCETSAGSFTVELLVDQMPITASNWIDLAKGGFYNGVHFHRVIPHFMAQFGCPNARDLSGHSGGPGTGGPLPMSTFTVLGSGESVTRRENRGKGAAAWSSSRRPGSGRAGASYTSRRPPACARPSGAPGQSSGRRLDSTVQPRSLSTAVFNTLTSLRVTIQAQSPTSTRPRSATSQVPWWAEGVDNELGRA